jgi:exopolysaccharide biosynthesis predicted pyruvyltransferase EpsI
VQTISQATTRSNSSAVDVWGGRQLIKQLQAKARSVLDPLIPAGSSVALLDYPNYYNVGDSLIWMGEIEYLRLRGLSPRYVCDIRNYHPERLRKALPNNPVILLQGGGNFGTLWPEIQDFRLKVLRDFPGVQVIQLPQSIHFKDELVPDDTAHAIRAHGNYTLLVRDQPSHDFATRHFDCTVMLCPDMAFFIGKVECDTPPRFDRFILSRTDHEKSTSWLDALPALRQKATVDTSDWLQAGWHERVLSRVERHSAGLRSHLDPHNRVLLLLWNRLAHARLKRGAALLQRGRVVISDRLHVHILSILMNKPHVLLDNLYGKLGNLHAAWTTPYLGVQFVQTLSEAFEVALVLDSDSRHSDRDSLQKAQA